LLRLDFGEGVAPVGLCASVSSAPLNPGAALGVDRRLLLSPILLAYLPLAAILFLAFGEILQPLRQVLRDLVMFLPQDLPLFLFVSAELAVCCEIEHRVELAGKPLLLRPQAIQRCDIEVIREDGLLG
jgi:hypothetical protein